MSEALRRERHINALASGRRNSIKATASRIATGTITYAANFADGDTVILNGVTFTAKTAGAAGNQFNIGVDLSASITALVAAINGSGNAALTGFGFGKSGTTILTIAAPDAGEAYNAFTLGGSVGVKSGATLSGGLDATKLDVSQNSVFFIETLAGQSGDFQLPEGVEEGQEILLHFRVKGGGNASINGVFVEGAANRTNLTFDTVNNYARLLWTGTAWAATDVNGVLA